MKKIRKALPPKKNMLTTGSAATATEDDVVPQKTNPLLKKKTGLTGWMNKSKMTKTVA